MVQAVDHRDRDFKESLKAMRDFLINGCIPKQEPEVPRAAARRQMLQELDSDDENTSNIENTSSNPFLAKAAVIDETSSSEGSDSDGDPVVPLKVLSPTKGSKEATSTTAKKTSTPKAPMVHFDPARTSRETAGSYKNQVDP